MLNRLLLSILILLSLSSSSLSFAQEPKYDLPGNRQLTEDNFPWLIPSCCDPRVLTVSKRLIPWSNYAGVKDTEKSISPDRMVWETLTVYCRRTPLGEIKYYYSATDAETRQSLTKVRFQYTRDTGIVKNELLLAPRTDTDRVLRCG